MALDYIVMVYFILIHYIWKNERIQEISYSEEIRSKQ